MPRFVPMTAGLTLLSLVAACGVSRDGSSQTATACPPSSRPVALQASNAPGADPDGVRESFLLTMGLAAAGKAGGWILGGLLELLFGGDDDDGQVAAVARDCPPPRHDFTNADVPAGIGYQVYRIGDDGTPAWADPRTTVFRTGDRVVVGFVTNLPGVVTAYNRNPRGLTLQIGRWEIADVGGERLPRDGAFRFVEEPGAELLILAFQPCRPEGRPGSGFRPEAVEPLPSCRALSTPGGLESIVYDPSVTVRDGQTTIRLVPYSEADAARTEPVVVPIRLVHD